MTDVSQELLNMSGHILNMVETFKNNSKVFVQNQDVFVAKLTNLVDDGPSKLQVIADYDWTLTKSNIEGVPTMHSYDMFACIPSLNDTYQEKKEEFLHKYVNMLNEAADDEEKHYISKMWYEDHEKLIKGVNITINVLKQVVVAADVPLRDGCVTYTKRLAAYGIPLTVLSSGIGDIIQLHLQQEGVPYNNTVSNFLNMDDDIVQGFKEPFISTYNKDKILLPVERPNIILIGDSLEDSKMGDSIHGRQTVLKIGFCPARSKVSKYLEYFDIVLVDDQTMEIIEAITSPILVNYHIEDEL